MAWVLWRLAKNNNLGTTHKKIFGLIVEQVPEFLVLREQLIFYADLGNLDNMFDSIIDIMLWKVPCETPWRTFCNIPWKKKHTKTLLKLKYVPGTPKIP